MRLFIPVILLLSVTAAEADQAAEREQLARLAHELEALDPLIDAAQAEADYPARIRFQYPWLRQDLAKVRQGILEHLNAPQGEPRQVPPLAEDYRR
ncbi:MAG: RAQPRD family integrative conjugative element protein [Acidobacteria bacterium]|nr:RAQPRD family integrative conjugative element protein [Acidobacteriota bacterium]